MRVALSQGLEFVGLAARMHGFEERSPVVLLAVSRSHRVEHHAAGDCAQWRELPKNEAIARQGKHIRVEAKLNETLRTRRQRRLAALPFEKVDAANRLGSPSVEMHWRAVFKRLGGRQ